MTIHLVSTRRARNTQARDLAAPKKGKKRTQTRKAAPDEQETPKRGIWHRPQKRQPQARKAAPDEQETPKRGIWHRPPKNAKKKQTRKAAPDEQFGIAPKKGKAALG